MAGLADREEVRAHLVAAAIRGEALSYSDLLGRLGYSFSRPKMRQLCKVLSAIDEEAAASGEPELAVLVVRESDGLPGQGWWVGRRDYRGLWEGPEARAFITRIQAATFGFWASRDGTGGVEAAA